MHDQFTLALRLVLATALGAAIGYQRTWAKKPAGLRTHSVVALGVATFTMVSIHYFNNDPRIAAGVVSGIGFIGAGTILRWHVRQGDVVVGLTTAATVFAVAAIAMASAVGMYVIAVAATALCVGILFIRHGEG